MGRRVLVVDDEAATCRCIAKALQQDGLDVATAANGAEALMAVEKQCPDLVILDVMMPVLDGFQTLTVLRSNDSTKGLPVLMLTARDEDAAVTRGWTSGVDLYLTKPFQLEELMVAVRRLLAAAEGQAAAT